MPGAANKKPVIVPVIVGERRFELKGTASFNEMSGGATPSVTFDRDNGMLDALMSGSSAQMLLGKKSFRFHLNGSRKAFDVMLVACPPPSP
ncbi:MAG: hypothetical protein KKB37_09365 [Alphaproteobacteria bacterium]|nr:hypothetical protein [Alphaproteobacteria bacterium]